MILQISIFVLILELESIFWAIEVRTCFLFIMFITCQQLILNLQILNLCHEDEFVYLYNKKVNKAPNLYKICRFRIGY